jgi:hypothetical protein
MADTLDDIETIIESALRTSKLVAEFHERLDEAADNDEAHMGVLMRMAWQCGPASPVIAQRVIDFENQNPQPR